MKKIMLVITYDLRSFSIYPESFNLNKNGGVSKLTTCEYHESVRDLIMMKKSILLWPAMVATYHGLWQASKNVLAFKHNA